MSNEKPKSTDLRTLKKQYSPNHNPLVETNTMTTRKKLVKSGLASKTLADIETGEITAAAVIREIREVDEEHFVKMFAPGIAAAYDLSRTAHKVFVAVLQAYEETPMNGGFAEAVYLTWFDNGLSGKDIGISEKTFNRGLVELMGKNFLAPRTPNVYWVNPALFFKGDRVIFMKEYRRVSNPETETESP